MPMRRNQRPELTIDDAFANDAEDIAYDTRVGRSKKPSKRKAIKTKKREEERAPKKPPFAWILERDVGKGDLDCIISSGRPRVKGFLVVGRGIGLGPFAILVADFPLLRKPLARIVLRAVLRGCEIVERENGA